jgi:hypothetical protein
MGNFIKSIEYEFKGEEKILTSKLAFRKYKLINLKMCSFFIKNKRVLFYF